MKKELKRHIKEDELVTGVEHAFAWAKAHEGELRVGLAVAAGLALLVGGIAYFQASRQKEAHASFIEALTTFDAPVAAELPPGEPKPTGPVFATAEEKFKKAAAAFDGVGRAYPSLKEGRWAQYFAALSRSRMGDRAEAEKQLGEVEKATAGAGLEPSLARVALANLQRSAGALDKAAESYKKLADDASLALPRDYVLMDLGLTLEEANRLDEAREAYRRVADEFPDGVYAADARRRADYLKPATQG
jgi:tetratricopeptide (TPR) repeat protein